MYVRGYVENMYTRLHLQDVKVTAMDDAGCTVCTARTYNHKSEYGQYDILNFAADYYALQLPAAGRYILTFSAAEYDTLHMELNIPLRQYRKKTKVWYPEPAKMEKPATMIKELSVQASRLKLVTKGDTVIYDASLFRLAEGSMLDALIRQLPGVRLEKDGRIYVNGRYVQDLLVDGRSFFSGDPAVALSNLPAYTVDKVKVYEKETDWDYLRNPANHRSEKQLPLVMDVNLKKSHSIGWMSNVEGAYGTHGRYMGRLFGMRRTDHSRLAFYASADNVNDSRTPGESGEWSPAAQLEGSRERLAGGMDLHVDSHRNKAEYNATLQGVRQEYDSRSVSSGVQFQPTQPLYSRSSSLQNLRNGDLLLKQTFKLPAKKFFLEMLPNFSLSRRRTDGEYLSALFDENPLDSYRGAALDSIYSAVGSDRLGYLLASKLSKLEHRTNEKIGMDGRMTFFTRSPLFGNTIMVTADGNWERQRAYAQERYDFRQQTEAGDYRDNYRQTPSSRYSYQAEALYRIVHGTTELNLSYKYMQEFHGAHQSLYRLDHTDGYGQEEDRLPFGHLPSAMGWREQAVDAANSYHMTCFSRRHVPKLVFCTGSSEKAGYVQLTVPVTFQKDRADDLHDFIPTHGYRHSVYVDVEALYKVRDLRLSYDITHSLPAMNNLLEVREDSDPMHVYVGNSQLKKGVEHQVSLQYEKFKTRRNWNVYGKYTRQHNALCKPAYYDSSTGIYTHRPENVNGNWNAFFYGEQAYCAGKNGAWEINNVTRFSFGHNVDYVSDTGLTDPYQSLVQQQNLDNRIKVTFQIGSTRLGAIGSVGWTHLGSPRPGFTDIRAADIQYGVTCSTRLPWSFFLETDLTMYHRRGYADHSMNTNDLVWNGGISRALGKGKRWTAKVTGFDLLHQLSSIRQQVNAQGRTETWHNTLPSYAMLHVKYMLDVKPKKKQAEK